MSKTHLHPPFSIPQISRLGRLLAIAQVAKETLSIIFLGLPLVKAMPLVLLSAFPGVVLYLLHWHLALGRAGRVLAAGVWLFTLIDELWGVFLFQELDTPTRAQTEMLYWSFFLGLGISLLALAELAWRWQRNRIRARRNVYHQALMVARQRR